MNTSRLLEKASIVLFGLSIFTQPQAALVTVSGTDVDFTYDDSTLFGVVTVVGNTFFFTPDNFLAESLNGQGVVSTNETLDVDITVTTPGFEIDMLFLRERGDYRLSGNGSTVSVEGQFIATSNATLCGGSFPCEDVMNFNGGTLNVQNSLTPWEINESIDLTGIAGWGSDTDISLTLENILTANTIDATSSQAFIQKKFGGIALSVNIPPSEVPVPAAVWLFGSGLLGLLAASKRK